MIMSEELLHCVYLNFPLQDTSVLQGFVYVSSSGPSHDVCWMQGFGIEMSELE